MTAEQTRKTIHQIDSEIAALEKKLADLSYKEAQKIKHANDIQKSISKNTSVSAVNSKIRQIQSDNNDLAKITSDKAGISKNIAEKRKKRTDVAIRLQREETDENKKAQYKYKSILQNYEQKIFNLTSQLNNIDVADLYKTENTYTNIIDVEYDVFISHASEDKESFVDEFCRILKDEFRVNVWYDTLNISWGSSLRAEIDKGIAKSKFGIIIISKSYIQKGWTQYELDGLFQREMTDGKIILPIWHNITKQEVQDFSPSLAGKKAISTAVCTAREIAENFMGLLNEIDAQIATT
jgi:hypothetical protein